MNSNFPRIMTLLRKEQGYSQKKVAEELGVSQALLSHYEKGIRECGLDFVVRAADFYNVSCDYLLGRTPDRSGATLTVEDIPEPDAVGKENVMKGSLLPVLNKKLLANSLNIIFSLLQKCGNKALTTEISACLTLSVYKAFRILYSANPKNPRGMFASPPGLERGLSDAALAIAQANAEYVAGGEDLEQEKGLKKDQAPVLSPELIQEQYPLFAGSLFHLVQSAESRMGMKNPEK
ncbi:helix-turn-helix domain-containing protein [Faecalispora anaeroviscerum]|uniref:helix-turn-helix domain-containing protein n=1 Tax=Faecalispora anaeroviscerum TaxID=2991836 RepID=UPI0024B98470|nr:helix-turn-helix transcriptional regulator [Faecalispora anaeroviscerum]